MTRQVLTVTPTTTIGAAIRVARDNHIRHLPVVQDGKLVGIVSERELRLAAPPFWSDQPDEMRLALETKTVGDCMTRRVITAAPNTPVEEAARLLHENRISSLPVLDGDELVGILTETDLLRALVELFGGAKPATRVEIRMPNRAGELARVVRVIGIEHKVNIVGLVVPPTPPDQDSVAIIQLGTTNPLPIIEALRKLGYKVGWPAIDLDPDADRSIEPELSASWRNRIPLEL